MSWSDLPTELLVLLSKCLDTDTDITRFRAVCSSWRLSILPPQETPKFPLMLPFPVYSSGLLRPERRGYFKLSKTTVYHLQAENYIDLGSTQNKWLTRVKETEQGKIEMRDPFGRRILEFSHSSKVINLLNLQLSEITKLYDLEYIDIDDIPVYSLDEDSEAEALLFRDVILSSKPVSNSNDYAILAINYVGILCYTKLGDGKWKTMLNVEYNGISLRLSASHAIDYKRKFYVVNPAGLVLVISYSFEIISTIVAPNSDNLLLCYYLASFGGNLFLVKENSDPRKNLAPCHVNVYKFDEEHNKWIEVTSIGEGALFLCPDICFSVSVKDSAGLIEKGCVYFLDSLSFGIEEHNIPVWAFSVENGSYRKLPCTRFLK